MSIPSVISRCGTVTTDIQRAKERVAANAWAERHKWIFFGSTKIIFQPVGQWSYDLIVTPEDVTPL